MQWYYWLIVAICSVLSMFFSAADMVYGMVDKDRLNREKGKKEKRAKLAIKIADDYELSISAILLGNNIVNVLAASIVTIIGLALAGDQEIGSLRRRRALVFPDLVHRIHLHPGLSLLFRKGHQARQGSRLRLFGLAGREHGVCNPVERQFEGERGFEL